MCVRVCMCVCVHASVCACVSMCSNNIYLCLPLVPRWSGFLLCSIAMLLVIFPMFAFPKKLPPRHKKKKKKMTSSLDDVSSDDDFMMEKGEGQNVQTGMGVGKDSKGVVVWVYRAVDYLFNVTVHWVSFVKEGL